jgi:hypothetical protein
MSIARGSVASRQVRVQHALGAPTKLFARVGKLSFK